MKLFLDDAVNAFICIFGVAIAWVLLFKLNMVAFSYFETSKFINWVFIPAGVRLISVLLFGLYGVIGLFFGALATSYHVGIDTDTAIAVSLISVINPYLAINLTKYCLKIDELMQGLKAKQLLTISFFAALFNGLTHNLYFHAHMGAGSLADFMNMFIGDFIGSLIILYTFSFLIKWLRRSIKPQTQP
ncbi:MAG: hypothetical protein EBR59_11455 [Methylococcaceae bacterium]|nr:hypothetical protein [Methylococcaceae bacterium]